MSKVYVVTRGHYSDYHIVGIYAREDVAQLVADRYNAGSQYSSETARVEEWDMWDGPQPEPRFRVPRWYVEITDNGEVRVRPDLDYNDDDLNKAYRADESPLSPVGYHCVIVAAETPIKAHKIAVDLIAQYKAEQEGIA